VTDDELRDLAERTHQLVQLAKSPGWALFVDRASIEIARHQRLILGGRLDEAAYRRETGWLEGAQALLAVPEKAQSEYAAALLRAEEEAEQRAIDAAEQEDEPEE
jgi:hypothetical protein